MLTRNHRQESLSRAYVQAIAGKAGFTFSTPSHDYGIDLTLNDVEQIGDRHRESGYRLDVQAKSTTLATVTELAVRYEITRQAYEDLRTRHPGCPRILVVLVLPADEGEWCTQTAECLAIRQCAYWLSLRGRPPARNRRSVGLRIPLSNVFSADALQGMMKRIKTGEWP